jgi:hypothetical protein
MRQTGGFYDGVGMEITLLQQSYSDAGDYPAKAQLAKRTQPYMPRQDLALASHPLT